MAADVNCTLDLITPQCEGDLKGTHVAQPLVPNGLYPTHDQQYGKGGFKQVATIEQMQEIPESRLTEGTICYVKSISKFYQFKENQWHCFDILTLPDVIQYLIDNHYVTQEWVNQQDFATKTWVNEQGFLKDLPDYDFSNFVKYSDLQDYATQDWVRYNFYTKEQINAENRILGQIEICRYMGRELEEMRFASDLPWKVNADIPELWGRCITLENYYKWLTGGKTNDNIYWKTPVLIDKYTGDEDPGGTEDPEPGDVPSGGATPQYAFQKLSTQKQKTAVYVREEAEQGPYGIDTDENTTEGSRDGLTGQIHYTSVGVLFSDVPWYWPEPANMYSNYTNPYFLANINGATVQFPYDKTFNNRVAVTVKNEGIPTSGDFCSTLTAGENTNHKFVFAISKAIDLTNWTQSGNTSTGWKHSDNRLHLSDFADTNGAIDMIAKSVETSRYKIVGKPWTYDTVPLSDQQKRDYLEDWLNYYLYGEWTVSVHSSDFTKARVVIIFDSTSDTNTAQLADMFKYNTQAIQIGSYVKIQTRQ